MVEKPVETRSRTKFGDRNVEMIEYIIAGIRLGLDSIAVLVFVVILVDIDTS